MGPDKTKPEGILPCLTEKMKPEADNDKMEKAMKNLGAAGIRKSIGEAAFEAVVDVIEAIIDGK